MTNGDRLRNLSNEMIASVYYNLKENAIYSGLVNRRLLGDTPEDFLIWLEKETEDFEEDIFKLRMKKVTLSLFDPYNENIDIYVPFYRTDDEIKALFWEIFGVEYNSDYCTYIFWS